MRRSIAIAIAIAVTSTLAALCACGTFGTDATPTDPTAMTMDAADMPKPDGGVLTPDGAAPACQTSMITDLVIDQDTTIFRTDPCSSVSFGGHDFAVAGQTNEAALFRFKPKAEVMAAIAKKAVTGATLTIDTYSECLECGGAFRTTAGMVVAHLMRADWDEGNGNANSGANECRRTMGTPGAGWGAALVASSASQMKSGADYATEGVATSFATDAAGVALPVDVAGLTKWSSDLGVSILVELASATPHLALATREATGKKAPTLTITYCAD